MRTRAGEPARREGRSNMTEQQRKETLFDRTMTRLAHLGIEGDTISAAHIVALAEEIEMYREKIAGLEKLLAQISE